MLHGHCDKHEQPAWAGLHSGKNEVAAHKLPTFIKPTNVETTLEKNCVKPRGITSTISDANTHLGYSDTGTSSQVDQFIVGNTLASSLNGGVNPRINVAAVA